MDEFQEASFIIGDPQLQLYKLHIDTTGVLMAPATTFGKDTIVDLDKVKMIDWIDLFNILE